MTKIIISEKTKDLLKKFLIKHKKADLVATYFFYLERQFEIEPVLFIKEKRIYQRKDVVLKKLEDQGKLWRETEIKIQPISSGVNSETKKIYICPFTGKVFGDNTHPNPQDAIYTWVSRCPENKERIGGMKVKRFFVSEDKELIKTYIKKTKKTIVKTVFSSALSGKLFNNKESVIDDFIKTQLKKMTLIEVSNQNKFHIEEGFMEFIQEYLDESKISSFLAAMSKIKLFSSYVKGWTESS